MSTTAWASIVADVLAELAEIAPTVDPAQRWRPIPRSRPEGEGGRDREFTVRRWRPIGGVAVFGGGEDQLARDLLIETWYTAADDEAWADRVHADERDLVANLEPQSTYPSGSGWSLEVRRVVREAIDIGEPQNGAIRVTYPVRLIWREPVSRL